jgi:FMN phosphatase YigB (HAD superfamily)
MDLQAVLFDLDNTLILFDEALYFERYMTLVNGFFADLITPDEFRAKLLQSTQSLLDNRGRMSNADFFRKTFDRVFGAKSEDIWNRFLEFYSQDMEELRQLVHIPQGVQRIMACLQEQELKLVIASNPILPLDLQLRRLSWAGIEDISYELVTHMGNMSFCKPQVEYYEEICRKIDIPPRACLMVGNDPVNDMVVSKIAMKAYLTTDSLWIENSNLQLSRRFRSSSMENMGEPDFSGPLSGVMLAVDYIRMIEKPA